MTCKIYILTLSLELTDNCHWIGLGTQSYPKEGNHL